MDAINRFINYTKINTTSDPNSTTAPSTKRQFDLATLLVKELKELNVDNVELTNEGIVYAWIEANEEGIDPMGLIAHMDTSSDASGENVKAKIVHFDGLDILLNEEKNIYLKVEDYPFMKNLIGKDLIVTDGTTLLGADDKAGIAIIMEVIKYLQENKDVKHGKICIAFTPDEEVGRGVENFDIEKFNAKFAFTIDGGHPSDAEYETFNAASASVKILGRSVHPGSAKNIMINASLLGIEFNEALNNEEIPSKTEGREGFHHLHYFNGTCEEATLEYILRNHDLKLLNKKKEEFKKVTEKLNEKYNGDYINLTIKDSYPNMRQYIEKHPAIMEVAYEAISRTGLKPHSSPVRGGTDGSNLSLRGLPTPNLGTGGYNYHGRFEFLCIEEFLTCIEIVKNIVSIVEERKCIVNAL